MESVRAGGEGDSFVDGDGEDEAVAVVGVFADEVGASGGMDEDRFGCAGEMPFEEGDGFLNLHGSRLLVWGNSPGFFQAGIDT